MGRTCENCGTGIDDLQSYARFCSGYCRGITWHRNHYKPKTPPPLERLLRNTVRAENGCLEWTAATFGDRGYGAIGLNGKTIGAHRAHWLLVNGPIPDGLVVRHKCDNRVCVDLNHLELGTTYDNVHDAIDRGRWRIGEDHATSRLTNEQVREIRERYEAGGVTQYDLADDYGVSQVQIGNITNRKHWRHVA